MLRLKRVGEGDYSFMPDDQLKMFALGDLNIVAGRYAMLQTPERIGNDLVIDKLGAVQYALYKVASIFSSPTVFREYVPEVMIGETMVTLPVRHVIWMQQLIIIFYLNPELARQGAVQYVWSGNTACSKRQRFGLNLRIAEIRLHPKPSNWIWRKQFNWRIFVNHIGRSL